MIKGVLLDLSGVLYVGEEALPGSHEALRKLKQAAIPVRYLTNTTRRTASSIRDHLSSLGFQVGLDELFTATQAATRYINDHDLKPYLVVQRDVRPQFPATRSGEENAVLIGDAADEFTYQSLNEAFRILLRGVPLIAMGYNRFFKDADGISLDLGPFVAALEFAADVQAKIIGKPSEDFFHAALMDLNCKADEVVMVGDDVEADVIGACNAGLQALLVKTGKYRVGDEGCMAHTDAHLVNDIGDAADWILNEG